MEYELGMIYDLDRISFRAATWYYDIQDFINDNGITAPGSGAGSNCLYNIDHVKLYGVELEAALRITHRLRATAAYVFQEHDISQTGHEQDWTYYLPATLPRHKIKVSGSYEFMDKAWVQLSGRFVGSRGSQKGGKLGSYTVWDLGVKKTFQWNRISYSLHLFVNNVLDADYQEISGYPMPGQVWGARMEMSF